MAQQSAPSTPVLAPEPYTPRPVALRVSQTELTMYWQCRRAVDFFEAKLRNAEALRVEAGKLTVPALRSRV